MRGHSRKLGTELKIHGTKSHNSEQFSNQPPRPKSQQFALTLELGRGRNLDLPGSTSRRSRKQRNIKPEVRSYVSKGVGEAVA